VLGALTLSWGAAALGCDGTEFDDATVVQVAAPPAPADPLACPPGTTRVEGLCLAPGELPRQAAAAVRAIFAEGALGGLILGVWKGGQAQLVGALGESLTGVPATVDMHHLAGNFSTSVLQTVALQAVDAGYLSLSDRLSRWYPDLPSADQITVDMLAHSTTGYAHYTQDAAFQEAFYANPFRAFSADEIIAYGVAGGTLYPPGTNWNFSDTNFLILAQVVEKATGSSFGRLVTEGVLKPLGMSNTTLPLNANLLWPVLHSYTDERGVWEEATFWNPSWTSYVGGLGTNQEDVRRFMEALASGALLSPESHALQLAPSNVGLGPNTPERYYAMGIGVVNGWLFLNPNLQGLNGAFCHLREASLTIVVYNTRTQLSNQDTPYATLVANALASLFSPGQPLNALV
jgi:D-alanyl-D-alanine carboxypeptidase